jgi:hypothetical protein
MLVRVRLVRVDLRAVLLHMLLLLLLLLLAGLRKLLALVGRHSLGMRRGRRTGLLLLLLLLLLMLLMLLLLLLLLLHRWRHLETLRRLLWVSLHVELR